MLNKIFKCPKCSRYTMERICTACRLETLSPKPARYKTRDNYSKYRLRYNETE